ncbi:M1 family metallopeptidase [Segetibacter aerophilus]|uniref:Peptidase M1 n=1 Tax=Segetibacter aerophilus TaxID=670293 RepID=A0A512B6U4_9BACT|nr:M1 family metallopeptidase [Segetibacter aerophilus]GEO07680.1 peptidase M1 [Segetibacter aerophilus]
MKRLLAIVLLVSIYNIGFGQPDRWQQRISYNIDVKMDVASNKFDGVERIEYTNNSPDTLNKVYFHTYWNAFQPNSSMDARSRELGKVVIGVDRNGKDVRDWDPRVKDRILNAKPDEIGYQKVLSVKTNGRPQKLKEHETILEVILDKPILPKTKVSFDVSFQAQVPIQIRRSGRDNAQGVKYSMAQWYPKMVEYDYQGWNANQYIAREFYGVWGDYNVKISIDKSYLVAASGTLQNANQIGFGYEDEGAKVVKPAGNNLTWNFVAQNVHDFVWAADPNYAMIKRQVKNGPLLFIIYKNVDSFRAPFQKLADTVELAYPVMAKTFGAYPYKNYSFIQGGDGGMEYPMATLIKNAGIGTAVHEWMHSWYQGMMGTNESLHPWMDEGFTTYAEERVMAQLRQKKAFEQDASYDSYYKLVKSGFAEPMTTHSDHYSTNYAYGQNAYSKGAVFMAQLGYITGDKVRDQILHDYYRQWRFKHPNPNDFIRVAEKASGMQLQWYREYWVNTTKTIDYAIDSLWEDGAKTKIRIRRIGEMPMPIDVQLTFKDGSKELHYIPLDLMLGEKPVEDASISRTVHQEWRWTHPNYVFETTRKLLDVTQVEIDPSERLADINKRNNILKIAW